MGAQFEARLVAGVKIFVSPKGGWHGWRVGDFPPARRFLATPVFLGPETHSILATTLLPHSIHLIQIPTTSASLPPQEKHGYRDGSFGWAESLRRATHATRSDPGENFHPGHRAIESARLVQFFRALEKLSLEQAPLSANHTCSTSLRRLYDCPFCLRILAQTKIIQIET